METDYNNIEQKQPTIVKGEIFEEDESGDVEQPKAPPAKKPSLFSRAFGIFLGTNGVKSWIEKAADDTWRTVIKPNIKSVVADAMHNMVNGVVYRGEDMPYTQSKTVEKKDKSRNNEEVEYNAVTASPKKGVKPVIFPSRQMAEDVLMELNDIIDRNGVVRVSEYYDICSIKPEWVDNYYGWADIESARLRSWKDGSWILYMPKPISI